MQYKKVESLLFSQYCNNCKTSDYNIEKKMEYSVLADIYSRDIFFINIHNFNLNKVLCIILFIIQSVLKRGIAT